eukprot:SAG22_NODE_2286_length_2757_cov_1.894281_2_plen_158_part_00
MMDGQHSAVTGTTDAGMGDMELWIYYVDAPGTVCLGGNNAPGIGSNYLIAVGEPTVHADDCIINTRQYASSSYLGCFRDNNGFRDLPVAMAGNSANDVGAIDECANKCNGYAYFGLQWSNECFCGNSYSSQGAAGSAAGRARIRRTSTRRWSGWTRS